MVHDKGEYKIRSSYPYFVYIDNLQYRNFLDKNTHFYLIFELSKKNRKSLFKIIQDCIDNENFHGIIFVINKNELLLDRIFFLKELSLKLFKSNKEVGLWGIPYCVRQLIFGSFDFSQFAPRFIPEESQSYSKYTPTYRRDSSLLLKCVECIASSNCDGLGSRKENHSMWSYRTSHAYRKKGRDALFKTDNEQMQKLYDEFCDYIDHSDLTYADRYLYFVKNLDLGSSYSFSDRFVYHCDFPAPHEYEQELIFLGTHVQNKNFLPMISELVNRGEICRIGYTKAEKDNVSRESFYVNPNGESNYYLLKYFGIDLELDFPNKFYGVGVDFYNGEIKSYKVYCMVPTEILLQMRPQYFEEIGIDLLSLHEKEHYYIVRLDANKKRVSERIDLMYNDKDYLRYKPYIKHLSLPEKFLRKLHIFAFAFEFEAMQLNKMNIYYRNRF